MNAARRSPLSSFVGDAPPALLPEQIPERASRADGCRRLVASVLETAIDDCIHRARRREGIEASEWIFASDTKAPLPFRLVCDVLDVDPGALRRQIRIWQSLGRRPARLTDAID